MNWIIKLLLKWIYNSKHGFSVDEGVSGPWFYSKIESLLLLWRLFVRPIARIKWDDYNSEICLTVWPAVLIIVLLIVRRHVIPGQISGRGCWYHLASTTASFGEDGPGYSYLRKHVVVGGNPLNAIEYKRAQKTNTAVRLTFNLEMPPPTRTKQ